MRFCNEQLNVCSLERGRGILCLFVLLHYDLYTLTEHFIRNNTLITTKQIELDSDVARISQDL